MCTKIECYKSSDWQACITGVNAKRLSEVFTISPSKKGSIEEVVVKTAMYTSHQVNLHTDRTKKLLSTI